MPRTHSQTISGCLFRLSMTLPYLLLKSWKQIISCNWTQMRLHSLPFISDLGLKITASMISASAVHLSIQTITISSKIHWIRLPPDLMINWLSPGNAALMILMHLALETMISSSAQYLPYTKRHIYAFHSSCEMQTGNIFWIWSQKFITRRKWPFSSLTCSHLLTRKYSSPASTIPIAKKRFEAWQITSLPTAMSTATSVRKYYREKPWPQPHSITSRTRMPSPWTTHKKLYLNRHTGQADAMGNLQYLNHLHDRNTWWLQAHLFWIFRWNHRLVWCLRTMLKRSEPQRPSMNLLHASMNSCNNRRTHNEADPVKIRIRNNCSHTLLFLLPGFYKNEPDKQRTIKNKVRFSLYDILQYFRIIFTGFKLLSHSFITDTIRTELLTITPDVMPLHFWFFIVHNIETEDISNGS